MRSLNKSYIRINNAGNHTDVQSNEIRQAEHVIAADVHPDESDQNVFEASDYGGGEGRVVHGAQDGGVHQQESHETGGQE